MDVLAYSAVGLLFGAGLIISGMVSRAKILNFLTFSEKWDPSLLIVFGTGVGINLIGYQLILKFRAKPVLDSRFRLPTNNTIDFKLVLGAVFFGLGWGFSGFCPGPFMMNLVFLTPHITLCFMVFYIIGQSLAEGINKLTKKSDNAVRPLKPIVTSRIM
jgi:uncharacterized membrane protein YedE/YeeE